MKNNDTLYARYAKEIRKFSPLTKEKERELSKRIQLYGDKDALMTLITANLKLVVYIAYHLYDNRYGLDFLDMVSEGNLALMDAASIWDCDKDEKKAGFGAFASILIRRAIMKHIYTDAKTVAFPVRNLVYKRKVRKEADVFEQKHHRNPTEEELACLTGLNERIIKLIFECDIPTVSLDLPTDKDDEPDTPHESRIDALQFDIDNCNLGSIKVNCSAECSKDIKETIQSIVNLLPPIQKNVIFYSYGLQGYPVLSSSEIANLLGKTSRRINQIKKEALKRLKLYNSIESFEMLDD